MKDLLCARFCILPHVPKDTVLKYIGFGGLYTLKMPIVLSRDNDWQRFGKTGGHLFKSFICGT